MADGSSNGRRLELQLPLPGLWSDLDQATENYTRILRERKVVATRVSSLRGKRERVAEAERVALAKAIKDGTTEPKSTLDKIDKDISVVGLNNTVTYKDGDPKVNDLGSGNSVKKG